MLSSFFRFFVISLLLPFAAMSAATESEQDIQQKFKPVDLAAFFEQNQISKRLAAEKKRLMLPPEAIRFNAQLMSAPKRGRFSLVYDALGLWEAKGVSLDEKPDVTYSAFIGSESGPVLGMYLSSAAAGQLQEYAVGDELTFYAVHLYNYSGGPRLVVLWAGAE